MSICCRLASAGSGCLRFSGVRVAAVSAAERKERDSDWSGTILFYLGGVVLVSPEKEGEKLEHRGLRY